nr:LacI family transcriptional regulator [Butyrivibrio sp.]
MSLKEIAKLTNSSISTVSRVLNDPSTKCASKQLKDRIWEVSREMGYLPNEAARSLQNVSRRDKKKNSSRKITNNSGNCNNNSNNADKNSTHASSSSRGSMYAENSQYSSMSTSGISSKHSNDSATSVLHFSVVIARISSLDKDPFFYELFRSIEEEVFKKRAVIDKVLYTNDNIDKDIASSDGIIILGRCSKKLYAQIEKANPNIVGIWRNPMKFNVDEVICDGKKAAEIAINHLVSLGHTDIAYIGNCSYESRYDGYCEALIRHGFALDMNLVRQTEQSFEEGKAAFNALLTLKKSGELDFSAIFCANDITAIAVLEQLSKEKKNIRESISVIAIDNIDESQNTKPLLTTIQIPRKEMS